MVKVIEQAMQLTEEWYGGRTAKRSGVPLINHIKEGVIVLRYYGASDEAIAAFILHPLFQADEDLASNLTVLHALDSIVVAHIMEYRNIANASLSSIVEYTNSDHNFNWEVKLKRQIKISPIMQVNLMLIADKVQNYKDFIIHHKGTHPRSEELDYYFIKWLEALSVSDQLFHKLCYVIKSS